MSSSDTDNLFKFPEPPKDTIHQEILNKLESDPNSLVYATIIVNKDGTTTWIWGAKEDAAITDLYSLTGTMNHSVSYIQDTINSVEQE